MKRITRLTLAAAAVAVATAGAAQAAATSSASFGNLVITLTDLDPNDGIAPSLTFQVNGKPSISGQTRSFGDERIEHDYVDTTVGQQGALSGSLNDVLASSKATVNSVANLAGFSSMATTGAALSTADGYGLYSSSAFGESPLMNTFTLSANTRITVTVDAAISVQTTLGYNSAIGQDEQANASLRLLLGPFGPAGTDLNQSLNATFAYADDGSIIGQSASWSGPISVSYSNLTAFDATGKFNAEVSVSGYSALAVPEPGSYAMLLAGLGLVGWRVGRRKV
ncbi:PEP-CTERM sorting domain-containing protein [Rugamonas sp.]|uniref:PEP-CTERM sorting domain-containing protein n=1 Tax=Rugamonas sp. TaxID=1926287 RepID=UPI0025E34F34|nr:PEP-CTERM sorting domain-containing protein [Rugamonas sp.]